MKNTEHVREMGVERKQREGEKEREREREQLNFWSSLLKAGTCFEYPIDKDLSRYLLYV